jgi:hypothetical protein
MGGQEKELRFKKAGKEMANGREIEKQMEKKQG